VGERRKRGGERWEGMRETGDKGKKGRREKGVEGERKEKRSGRRLHRHDCCEYIHTFVLLRDGNLICWWPSVIHV
jgi:hypothetical protein